jgi:peptidoglycan hydrolase-like protein with peptidoglycan-binding domain
MQALLIRRITGSAIAAAGWAVMTLAIPSPMAHAERDYTDVPSAGVGGTATASANGGVVTIGDVNSGSNSGSAIGVGDTRGANWPVVRAGASGETVQSLQLLLGQHGQAVTVDGDFGPQTTAAVRAFQQAQRLGVDGIVGPQTWPRIIVTVRDGSQGPAVRAVQRQLAARGVEIAVDGDFGPQTTAAVRAYQQQRGLAVDGVVGPQTWQALLAGR